MRHAAIVVLILVGCVDLQRPGELLSFAGQTDPTTSSFGRSDTATPSNGDPDSRDTSAGDLLLGGGGAQAGEASAPRTSLSIGSACGGSMACSSGHCVDGVCCESPCASTCHACNLPGSVGTCTPVPDGKDPGSECAAEPLSACGRAGGCNGAGACRRHPVGTACAAQTCTGATLTGAGQCNSTGVCERPAPVSCGDYLCSGDACGTNCEATSECNQGKTCEESTCVSACAAESDSQICARLLKNCGEVRARDNCATWRTVRSCGVCPASQACGADGSPNICGDSGPACARAYERPNCTRFVRNTEVSFMGRNWRCSSSSCANCATTTTCEPGHPDCPWGKVWIDLGACF